MDGAPRESWLGRPLLVGGALITLVALVVLAAHGHVATGHGGGQKLSNGIVDSLVSALLAVYALGAVVLFGALVWSRGEWGRRHGGPKRATQRLVPGLVLAFILLAVVLFSGDRLRNRFHLANPRTPTMQSAPLDPGSGGPAKKQKRQPHGHFRLAPFVAVLLGLGGAGALLLWTSRRTLRPPREPIAPALAEKIGVTLHDLREERDPRRAVIAAYRRMEQLLEETGVPRESAETPLEYMSRALLALGGGSRAVRALTRLFERARFSPHAIDETMKGEAIDAVEALQADIAAAEAAAEAA